MSIVLNPFRDSADPGFLDSTVTVDDGHGGVVTKLKMLAIEGAAVNHTPNLFD